ncbi:MAG: PIN domain-containing protein [Aliarcobacter cryaerophilus]|nr:PIN domain-containing protein [Aliarcobacter cryaerophilus]
MIRLDTNYIIRYLINDDEKMAEIAENIILNSITYISNEVLSEVIYVLSGVYNIPKKDICDMLIQLISFENIEVENKIILIDTIKIFQDKSLDFVDCLLCRYSKEDEIKTFDKKLLKCISAY